MSIRYINKADHDSLIAQGYTAKHEKTFSSFGADVYKHMKYTKEAPMGCCEVLGRVACGAIASAISVCLLPLCSRDFKQAAFDAPLGGEYTEEAYVYDKELSEQWQTEDCQAWGFGRTDKAGMARYFNENIQRAKTAFGHQYIILKGKKTDGNYILLIPYGNTSNIKLISLYNPTTGASADSANLDIHAKVYCGTYKGNSDPTTRVMSFDTIAAYGTVALLSEQR